MGFGIAIAAFSGLFRAVTGQAVTYSFATGVDWWIQPLNVLVILALSVVVIFPHEWLHGLAIGHYGGEPRYGVGVAHFVLPYAYATTDYRFTRNQFLVVCLTPLVVLTLVGVPAMLLFGWGWLALPLAANAGGAVGDLWMALVLVGYPSHVTVEDYKTGFRILGREGDDPRELRATAAVWDALVGAALATVGLLVFLTVGGLFLLDALGVESFTLGDPDTITFVFAYSNTPTEISVGVGPGVPVLGAALGLANAFVRASRRSARASAG
jgi:hypothetical protein